MAIKDEFVSFDTAKLLKDKKFEGEGSLFYDSSGKLHPFTNWWWYITPKERYEATECPTQSVVMRWLREVHNLYISIDCRCDQCGLYFCYDIIRVIQKKSEFIHCSSPEDYEDDSPNDSPVDYTYEEACEHAIDYCLKHVI